MYGGWGWRPYVSVAERRLQALREMDKRKKIIGAICHAPWILISAGVVKGRRISCPEDMADDVTNAGAVYATEKAVRDGNLITAYSFRFLPEHFQLLMLALAESRRS